MLRVWKFSDSQWTGRKSTGHNAKERSATNSATMRFIMPALVAVVYALADKCVHRLNILCMCMCIYIYTYIHIHVCACVFVRSFVHVCVRVCVCTIHNYNTYLIIVSMSDNLDFPKNARSSIT